MMMMMTAKAKKKLHRKNDLTVLGTKRKIYCLCIFIMSIGTLHFNAINVIQLDYSLSEMCFSM